MDMPTTHSICYHRMVCDWHMNAVSCLHYYICSMQNQPLGLFDGICSSSRSTCFEFGLFIATLYYFKSQSSAAATILNSLAWVFQNEPIWASYDLLKTSKGSSLTVDWFRLFGLGTFIPIRLHVLCLTIENGWHSTNSDVASYFNSNTINTTWQSFCIRCLP